MTARGLSLRCAFILLGVLLQRNSLMAQELLPVFRPVLCVGMDSVRAGEPAREGESDLHWHSMLTNIPDDWARFGKLTIEPSSIPAIAGVGLITAAFMTSDHGTYTATREINSRSPLFHSLSNTMVHFGDGRTHIVLAAGFALYGLAADDRRSLRTASQTVEVLLASGIVVQVLKRITGRESPEVATFNQGMWRFFPNLKDYQHHQARYYAFPSGHITTTMATVTVVAENYPEATWIRPVGYGIVGLVGVSLVNVGYHWYSDLPLGVLLGYTFGMIASHPNGWNAEPSGASSSMGVRVAPVLGPDVTGIQVAFMF